MEDVHVKHTGRADRRAAPLKAGRVLRSRRSRFWGRGTARRQRDRRHVTWRAAIGLHWRHRDEWGVYRFGIRQRGREWIAFLPCTKGENYEVHESRSAGGKRPRASLWPPGPPEADFVACQRRVRCASTRSFIEPEKPNQNALSTRPRPGSQCGALDRAVAEPAAYQRQRDSGQEDRQQRPARDEVGSERAKTN